MRTRSTKKGQGAERVFVGAFGKHPGWDDHIEDIGLATRRLIELKRFLYVEGIGGNIDAGAWDKLQETHRLEGFKHVFFWQTGGDLFLGRLWSSRDGKGRTKYPMVICTQCRDLPADWVLKEIPPRLEQIEQRCVATTKADDVVAIMDSFRQELRQLAEPVEPPEDPLELSGGALGRLAAREELGPEHQGMLRVLYQMDREMAEYVPGARLARDEVPQPHHLRVPLCGPAPEEGARQWIGFMMGQFVPDTPIMAIVPLGEDWSDLIVGEPSPSQFFVLRTSRKALPLTTEIPYTLDQEFLARARQKIADAVAGKETLPAAAAEPSHAARSLEAAREATVKLATRWQGFIKRLASPPVLKKVLPILAAVILGIVAIWVAIKIATSPSSKPPARESTTVTDSPADWERLCDAYNSWFAAFLDRMDAPRREKWLGDEELKKVLDLVTGAEANHVMLDPRRIADVQGISLSALKKQPTDQARSLEGVRKTQQALQVVAEVESAAASMVDRLNAAVGRFRSRGWTKPADQVAARVAEARADPKAPPSVAGVEKLAAIAGPVQQVETKWAAIEEQRKALEGSGDAVLAAFGRYALSATGSCESLRELLDQMQDPQSTGAKLAAFLQEQWKGIDAELFARERQKIATDGPPSRVVFDRWLEEAPQYRTLAVAEDPRGTPAHWDRRLDLLGSQVRALEKQNPQGAKEADARLKKTQEKIVDLWKLPGVLKNRGRIERAAVDADQLIAALATDVGIKLTEVAGTREDWIRGKKELAGVSTSESVNQEWRTRRDQLLTGVNVPGLTAAEYTEIQTKIRGLQDALGRIAGEDSLPKGFTGQLKAPQDLLNEASKLVASRREQTIKQVLGKVHWSGGVPDLGDAASKADQDALAQGYREWLGGAAKVISDAGAIQDALDAGCGLKDSMPGAARTVEAMYAELSGAEQAKELSAALKPVADRVAALKQIEASGDRKALADLAAKGGAAQPERTLAAWRRLGRLAGPSWPGSTEELSKEREIRGLVAGMAVQIKDRNPARASAVQDELSAEGHRRWAQCFAGLTAPADIEAAIDARKNFLVQTDKLQPALRLDILLYESFGRLEDLASVDESQLAARIDRFVPAARALPAEFVKQPAVGKFLADLEALKAYQGTGDDLSKVGPQSAGWQGKASSDGSEAVYSWQSKRGTPHELKFLLVKPGDGQLRPFYLCTTEVAVGLVLDVTEDAQKWDDLRALMKDLLPAGRDVSGDPRQGPRSWELGADGKTLRRTEEWLVRLYTKDPYYPPEIEKEKPKDSSPMQYVSADAAVWFARSLGCRLPTQGEWTAARQLPEKASPPEKWNLRDVSWARQKAHVETFRKAGTRLPWPDADVFWPKDSPPESRKEAEKAVQAVSSDDGLAWFADVNVGAGARFLHLVGNVAEFVYDDPNALERLADLAPKAVRALLDAGPDRLKVIGGSALSPPDLKVDQGYTPAMDEAHRGFSDVGLRLAFSAPSESPADRLVKLAKASWYRLKGK